MQITTTFSNHKLIIKTLSAADYAPTHEAMHSLTLDRIALKKQQNILTPDELWVVDHNDVYTLGQASKKEHILQQTNTPIIQTDRGGQVTWHGHGQLVLYWLFDLETLGWGVRHLVSHAEQALEDVLNECLDEYYQTSQRFPPLAAASTAIKISAHARKDAPGVYLYSQVSDDNNSHIETNNKDGDATSDQAIMLGKIASLGFKIKHGFCYHGIALNIDCDLSAFNAINPCGYAGMQMLRLADFVSLNTCEALRDTACLSYEQVTQKLVDNIAKRHAGLIVLR